MNVEQYQTLYEATKALWKETRRLIEGDGRTKNVRALRRIIEDTGGVDVTDLPEATTASLHMARGYMHLALAARLENRPHYVQFHICEASSALVDFNHFIKEVYKETIKP